MRRSWAFFFLLIFPSIWAEQIEPNKLIDFGKCTSAGDQEYRAGRFKNALVQYQKALITAKNHNFDVGWILSLKKSAICYWDLGDLIASYNSTTEALAVARRIGMHEEIRIISDIQKIIDYYREGKEQRARTDHRGSLRSFENAIRLSQAIKSEAHEAKCLRQRGITYREAGCLSEFRYDNEKAIALATKLNNDRERLKCLNNLGLYYSDVEDWPKAIALLSDGLIIARNINDKIEEASIYSNLGAVYLGLGHYKKALENFEKSKSIHAVNKDVTALAIDYINIGVIMRNQGVIGENPDSFVSALLSFRYSYCLTNNRRLEAIILNNMGFVYFTMKDSSKALKHFRFALKKAKKLKSPILICNILTNIGHVYNYLGLYNDAVHSFNEAIEKAVTPDSKRILWEAFLGLGRAWEHRNNDLLAEKFFWKSIACIESARNRIYGDEFKVSFFDNRITAYEALADHLFKKYIKEPSLDACRNLFKVIELAKGRAILDSLSRQKKKNDIDLDLGKKRENITRKLSEIMSKIVWINHQQLDIRDLNEQLEQTEDEFSRINVRIEEAVSKAGVVIPRTPYSLDEIQLRLLDDETGLLEFLLGENRSWLAFLMKGNQYFYELPPLGAIEASVKAFINALSSGSLDTHQTGNAARRIFRELLFPLEMSHARGLKRLIIIPDGPLCSLPFDALAVNNYDVLFPKAYLISQFQTYYGSSASSLLFLKERSNYLNSSFDKEFLAVGDPDCYLYAESEEDRSPAYKASLRDLFIDKGFSFSRLPYAEKEVRDIASFFPQDRRTILLKADGTEEAIKAMNLHEYRIIHFACHGFIDDEDPQRSALVLALDHDSYEDGFLQGREIGALNLQAELVVLSACHSASGSLKRGEGVLDLSRCFFQAGAKSVLASLWRINDRATAEFMKVFYSELVTGEEIALALRSAKLRLIESGLAHPFFWAGFVLNGDGSFSLKPAN